MSEGMKEATKTIIAATAGALFMAFAKAASKAFEDYLRRSK